MHVEEEEVAKARRIATMRRKPLQPHLVRAMAEAIRKLLVKGVNENGLTLVNYDALGKLQLYQFKKRQRNLQTKRIEKIDVVRNTVMVEELDKWFIKLDCLVRDFKILPKNIYNMDETGFNIKDFEAQRVVIDTTVNS